jgi:hypothetical protein
MDLLDALFIGEIAAYSVKRIRGVGYQTAFLQDVYHSLNQPLLGVFRVDGQDHKRNSSGKQVGVSTICRPGQGAENWVIKR